MANSEHLDLLEWGSQRWQIWRSNNPNIQPDLCEANLMGADLNGINLQNTDLSKANLIATDLSSANLKQADLSLAQLHRANLSKAVLFQDNLILSYNKNQKPHSDYIYHLLLIGKHLPSF